MFPLAPRIPPLDIGPLDVAPIAPIDDMSTDAGPEEDIVITKYNHTNAIDQMFYMMKQFWSGKI